MENRRALAGTHLRNTSCGTMSRSVPGIAAILIAEFDGVGALHRF
jgi:hypothetical protein